MKKRIMFGVILIGLIGSLAGAYHLGAQNAAQSCQASLDILITQPQDHPEELPLGNDGSSGWSVDEPTVDTVTNPAFNRA